jgi:heme A synthase
MPRAFAGVATGTAAIIAVIAVVGLVLAATSAPTYTGAFTILAGLAILTIAAGIATIKTGERIWGYLLATGMIATTTLAFYAAAA